jgi:hypothetical protein
MVMESSRSSPDPERADQEEQEEQPQEEQPKKEQPGEAQPRKQIEKVKADNEKVADKLLKQEIEKPPKREVKEKNEFKEAKNEAKELKREKLEKNEVKEQKGEKELKREKLEKEIKLEIKEIKEFGWEGKVPFEKQPGREGPEAPGEVPLPVDRESLAQHADALEQAARRLRHFIERGERPDLSGGALKDEPDQEDDG